MQTITIDGTNFDIDATWNPGGGDHVPRGIGLRVKCADGKMHDVQILETTSGIDSFSSDVPLPDEVRTVLDWVRRELAAQGVVVAGRTLTARNGRIIEA
jgi:hypothetical protein